MNETTVFGRKGDIEYSLYSDDDWNGVKEVFLTAFCEHENVCIATELNLPENDAARQDALDLTEACLRNGLSIVARDITTNRIVGHAVNTFEARAADGKFTLYIPDELMIGKDEYSRKFIDFKVPVDLLQHYNVPCVFDIVFLATRAEYKGAGIGRTLCEYSVQLARQLHNGDGFERVSEAMRNDGHRPQVVAGIFTSAFSQRIAERLGFERTGALRYEDVAFKGKTFAERINDARHKEAVLMSMRL